jgi:acyl carrier protein
MLTTPPEKIQSDTPLFGPNSLGLDSIDALQLSLAIETTFKTPIKDPELARQILSTPESICDWINKQRAV